MNFLFKNPVVMGILNITPDSFYDGGNFFHRKKSLSQVRKMIQEGASIIDVGGESTRPGFTSVSVQEELDRVIPIIEKIRSVFDVIISIDTSKVIVMKEAIKFGARFVNYVSYSIESKFLREVSKINVPVCITHSFSKVKRTKKNFFSKFKKDFLKKIEFCKLNGINESKIIIDPGFGFMKNTDQNYKILANLEKLLDMNFPIMVGLSRKSMIGDLLKLPVEERLTGSVLCALVSLLKGAKIIRTHDVKETVQSIKIAEKIIYFSENI
ncbi:hypothetical protein AOQ88_00930 [Candidatus Riesia sp. GBBU]|nr:hypothetical protein AOQ88_00930 [Candidatus Riesia sp. GBBU]